MLVRENKTKFVQVANELIGRIQSRQLQPGDKLPPEPELARSFGISRGTTRQALLKLEEMGYIRRMQGQGTFINDQNSLSPDDRRAGSLGFLLVESDPKKMYSLSELKGMENKAREVGKSVIFATLGTHDLVRDELPASIRPERDVHGVLLDGSVFEYHARLLEKFKMPYVVMGNHDLPSDVPQISYGFEGMTRTVCQYLRSLHRGPIALLLDRHRMLYYYNQMISGYNSAMVQAGELPAVYLPEEDKHEQVFHIIKAMTDRWKDQFCLLIVEGMGPLVLQSLDRVGLSEANVPIVALGTGELTQGHQLERIAMLKSIPYTMGLKASELLIEQIRTGEKKSAIFDFELRRATSDARPEFLWNFRYV